MHQNPGKLPRDPHAPYNYKHHLQKGSHARSYSLGQDIPTISPNTIGSIPTLHKSTARSSSVSPTRGEYVSPDSSPEKKSHHSWDSPEKKAYVKLATRNMSPERTFQASYIQGGPNGNVARGIFRNPRDCIYEEPETSADERIGRGGRLRSSVALNAKPNDPSPKTSSNVDAYLGRGYSPVKGIEKFSSVEIHKNPPTQSRNPAYTSNSLPPTPPDSATASDNDGHGIADEGEEEEKYAPRKDGIEIRGDDIRAATSMRLKDRSPRLPMPTVVSNKPGRHIVSFNKDWKPLQEFQGDHSEERRSDLLRTNLTGSRALPDPPSKPSPPRSIQSAPVIPTINLPEEPSSARGNSSTKPPIPTINVPDAPTITFDGPSKAPSINVSSSESGGPRSRPLPKTHGFPSRPLPFHSSTAPASSYHVTPTIRRPTAACSQCGMSIQGRTVSAGGFRFHPECFRCYNCGEGLECVAFYPEPDPKRAERLNRIRRRAKGEHIEHEEGKTKADDGEDAPRFYCHLDYHEFFSPRCRSCKTPIEGEVVVACGGEWHVGHFFCAECGDPFDPSTPFVEKDGYAWCVNCHTNRYSTRCRKCRKPVTDMVVKALGSEWHAQCFCCTECDAQFDDGRYFLRGPSKDPVCVACEERRLKA
ncbi:hypothetical protein L228DRAFT_247879 [Xylona heveae TC161]|uniref:LIM zinc-binding domain-containing protein n=1 Tax=Xylona heveae (strain CBS 132557 / TC161) TaxID=1328760 RepID=A0A165GIT4_XYLHT|nr:hypothetical protein L228DRAFT_247879 [Xylona heveae TC161]KZF22235.1 hypothetical protein L228DRAFT_247879 [Xylona heveae TC161]